MGAEKMGEVQKYEAAEPVQIADPMVSMIERVVMDPNASIEKLEKMLEMRERLDAQAARKAFSVAISAAKSEIGPIIKTGEVDYGEGQKRTHFKHETLDGIATTVDPILTKNGLSYRYRSRQENGALHVTCIVEHRDGHFEETTLQGSPDTSGSKNAYQAVGSAATYLQRYTLKLALGLSVARDDDGKGAEPAKTITADQYLALRDKLDASGSDEAKFLAFFKLDRLDDLPLAKFGDADAMLCKKLAAKREPA